MNVVPTIGYIRSTTIRATGLNITFIGSRHGGFTYASFMPIQPTRKARIVGQVFTLFNFRGFFFRFYITFNIARGSIGFFPCRGVAAGVG